MGLTIYHNPRCSKSRQTLALIEQAGLTPTIIRYLDTPLDETAISELLTQLGFDSPHQLIRKGEADYKALSLSAQSDDATILAAMASHPKLIERPIVTDGQRAVLGRPPENVVKILP